MSHASEQVVPHLGLNSGYTIPQLGLGVFKVDPDETYRIISDAIEIGYRHIDTAAFYANEDGVGRAIRESGLPREEFYVTTKVWRHGDGVLPVPEAFDASLQALGLDYVDLYLIHWPHPAQDSYVEAWHDLEQLAAQGRTRSIGVSNFEIEHLRRLISESETVPAVNQVELHPWFQQRELRAFQEPLGILTEVWGPLGQGKASLTDLPSVVAAAAAHGKSVQQVVIRWHLQEGVIVFPKSSSRERLAANFDVFDFELSSDEVAAIAAEDAGVRRGNDPKTFG